MRASRQFNTDTHVVYCGAHGTSSNEMFRGRLIVYEGKTIYDTIVLQRESDDVFTNTDDAMAWAESAGVRWLRDNGFSTDRR